MGLGPVKEGKRGGKRGEEGQQDATRHDWLESAPRTELNLNLSKHSYSLFWCGVVAETCCPILSVSDGAEPRKKSNQETTRLRSSCDVKDPNGGCGDSAESNSGVTQR